MNFDGTDEFELQQDLERAAHQYQNIIGESNMVDIFNDEGGDYNQTFAMKKREKKSIFNIQNQD